MSDNKLPVILSGKVINGNKIGRSIDMPTANIVPECDVSMLEHGVYYSRAYVNGMAYKGITNLGVKPTVQDRGTVNVETYIYDFDGNLYDEIIKVELLEFRRPEMKFNSVEELSEQMHRDLEAGKSYSHQK